MIDCKVYVAFHRAGKIISNDKIYTALHVGKMTSKLALDILDDAGGEQISSRNEIYSELTGWYWIWKNRKHDFVGTAHYRRYFTIVPLSTIRKIGKLLLFFIGLNKKRHGLLYVNDSRKWRQNILSLNDIQTLMKDFDVILPQKKKFKYSVFEQYSRRHNKNDVLLTRQIIKEQQPEYITAFDETFESYEMYSFNMFIMPWRLFNNYMEWLFGILFELEKRSDINMDDKYQKRVCAFMAERLQTVWIIKNKLKVKELPILYFKKMKTEHF